MPDVLKIAIPAVIVLIIAVIIGYYVLRHLRGSLKLSLSKTAFSPGEKVKGSFELNTKKEIEGKRLFVALIGERITEERDGDRTRTDTDVIFRSEQTIEEARTYPAGHVQQHSFEIATPESGTPEFLNSGLGKALAVGLQALGANRTRFRWKVEVRLDAKGIDLATSQRVNVNITSGL